MIFLTIGTHEPFDRLAEAFDKWLQETPQEHEVIAQVISPTTDAYKPRHFEMIPHMPPAEYLETILSADLIVSHAGMGSILTAFTHGKPIVIMPRRGHLRETRNDHQYTTVKNLGQRPGLFVAKDETEFSAVMDKALPNITKSTQPCLSSVANSGFTDALRDFIFSSERN